jgi:PHD/YefM family antitoxin component YafN of YafNO toxin-antitoxin module
MQKASAAVVAKNFGRYREAALSEPLTIQNHGRDSVVMVSAKEYHRLKKLDRRVLAIQGLSERDLRAISESRMDERHAHLDELMD